MNIFSYGTLQTGFKFHKEIKHFVKKVIPATIEGRMYSVLNRYPAVVEGDNDIQGQILVLEDRYLNLAFDIADKIEHHPDIFRREIITAYKGNKEEKVWCYLYNQPVLEGFELIECGNWEQYIEGVKNDENN